jgi:hypothetical protein
LALFGSGGGWSGVKTLKGNKTTTRGAWVNSSCIGHGTNIANETALMREIRRMEG